MLRLLMLGRVRNMATNCRNFYLVFITV